MVKFSAITEANSRFASDSSQNGGLVCVFAGATSNTGAGTIERMAVMLKSPTFYVLGRSEARFKSQRAKLDSLNSDLKIVFIEVDITLISDVDAASKQIAAAEKKVDYLYMSQGCIPLNLPQYTKEGLDMCFALSYYSRIRLLSNLLPLLRQSTRPRVLSLLNGGKEQAIRTEDLGLENAQNFSSRAAINHTTTMMTLALEYLSENDKTITFMHVFPGLVATDNFARLTAPKTFGILGKVLVAFISRFVSTVQWLFGISPADCGARQAFLLTGDDYGPGKMWRIDEKSEPVTTAGILGEYREGGWREKVWEYTVGVFEKALATGS
ncbi:Oxidoreductase lepF [Lachnellula suecica]|uniref:Oxidoreductase lepF n=1 Tax=Lachnellula suecica TaxID=602035 RepID=A0A8T9CC48_9HELO|nr:Oxidoreductase lepF [Lachnellula suecica]